MQTRSSLERRSDPARGSDGRVRAGHGGCTRCASRDSVARGKKSVHESIRNVYSRVLFEEIVSVAISSSLEIVLVP